jgi:integrase
MRLLGDGKWIFRTSKATPVNPGNVLKRKIRPVLEELGIMIGGWHDFRHTLATTSLKQWPTKFVSDILARLSVVTTTKVHQHTMTEDFRGPLDQIASQLIPDVTKPTLAN